MFDLKLEANLPDPEYGSCLSGEIGVPPLSDVARINSELLLILKSNRSSRLRKLVLFRLISLLIWATNFLVSSIYSVLVWIFFVKRFVFSLTVRFACLDVKSFYLMASSPKPQNPNPLKNHKIYNKVWKLIRFNLTKYLKLKVFHTKFNTFNIYLQ